VVYFLIRRFLWAIFLFFCATVITYIIFFVIPSDPRRSPAYALHAPADRPHPAQPAPRPADLPAVLAVHVEPDPARFARLLVRQRRLRALDHRSGRAGHGLARIRRRVFWLAISIPIGIISALRPRSVMDRFGMIFVLVGISAPAVWIGLILAYIFGFKLGWTPIAGYCNLIPGSGTIGSCSVLPSGRTT
jgi:ABC-type dipeptide/oligopeptide/nickel transport systems, permease components